MAQTQNISERAMSLDFLKNVQSPRKSARQVDISNTLKLEWRNPIEAEASDGVKVETLKIGQQKGLRLQIPSELGWVRLFAQSARPKQPSLVLLRLTLRITADAEAIVQPMWMETIPPKSSRREEVPNTRSKLKLTKGIWHTIHGVAYVTPNEHNTVPDFIMNLPEEARIDIAAFEASWVAVDQNNTRQDRFETIRAFTNVNPDAADAPMLRQPLANMASGMARLLSTSESLPKLMAQLLQDPKDQSDLSLLEVLLSYQGEPCAIVAPNIMKSNVTRGDRRRLDTTLVDIALQEAGVKAIEDLSEEDRLTLSALSRLRNDRGQLVLSKPRDLFVSNHAPSDEDKSYWTEQADSGKISGYGLPKSVADTALILNVPSAMRISPIALAAMRSLKVLESGASINEVIDSVDNNHSWRNRLGPLDAVSSSQRIGSLDLAKPVESPADAPLPNLVLAPSSAQSTAKNKTSDVALAQTYAFVVSALDPQAYRTQTNIENCRVFPSLEALRTTLAAAGEVHDHKPIVLLRKEDLEDPDYILHAVQTHWSFGGAYTITMAHCEYDAMKAQLSLAASTDTKLDRLALTAAISSLPAADIRQADATYLNHIASGLFVPACGFAVVVPYKPAQDAMWLQKRNSTYNREACSAAELDRFALSGPLDAPLLETLAPHHWRLGQIIGKRTFPHREARACMQGFLHNPTAQAAICALDQLVLHPEDWPRPNETVDQFLIKLAQADSVVAALPQDSLQKMLKAMRNSSVADQTARALAAQACDICTAGAPNILPFFELMAMSLNEEELNGVLLTAANQFENKPVRYTYRIAEALQRYGSETAVFCFIMLLLERAPEKLHDLQLLRQFKAVLNSKDSAVLNALVRPGFTAEIENQVNIIERFRIAISEQDRDTALRIMQDFENLASVDHNKWFDELRAFSNELHTLELPISELMLPNLTTPASQRLAALSFRDRAALTTLRDAGFLDAIGEQNAFAHSELGDNSMLNTLIAAPFKGTELQPLSVNGDDITSVYEAAQQNLAGLPKSAGGPLVSVIMSAFNPDIPLMRQAILSLKNQTHKNIELFVIDDASEPASSEQIAALVAEFDFAQLIKLEANAGPYVGRNLALQRAKGAFIAIHDADDWAHPQRFQAQLAKFAEIPEARLVTAHHVRIDHTGKVQMEAKFTLFGDGPMTSLFHRDVFDELGPFAKVRSRGDVEMRERIRSYYGHQAIAELAVPLMLCLATSQTLSQRTKQRHFQHLQLFRTRISQREPLAHYRRDNRPLASLSPLVVPATLRVTQPET